MAEWSIDMPWGKVAMVSWGDIKKPPILLLHGYMDTAATFIPLVNELPNNYHYVAFDIPGHGKSQPFPPGLLIWQLHVVEIIREIVEEMKWENFIFLAHSMGTVIGMLYNYLYPNKISKMIFLDPGPPISVYYYVHHKPAYWYNYVYNDFFNSYDSYTNGKSKLYTAEEAIRLVVRNRGLTEDQAEVVLSRSLVPMGDGKFKLSWDSRMKKIATVPLSEETLYTIITTNLPHTLCLLSSENTMVGPAKNFTLNVLEKSQLSDNNFNVINVVGNHDVHITNPDLVANYIIEFLRLGVNKLSKCKL